VTRTLLCLLALVAFMPAARADLTFVNCDADTLTCTFNDSAIIYAVIGVDTVYAPDGTTVLETLSDVVIDSPLGPLIANDIATDTGNQPPLLQDNLTPFTTLTNVQFAEDNEFNGQDLPGCPTPPNEMLTEAGSLISGVSLDYLGKDDMGDPIFTSPSIYTDLTGAVSGATVTSDVVSNAGSDVYSYHLNNLPLPVCGSNPPAGYSVDIVQSMVVDTSIENITEEEDSSVPEPGAAMLIGSGLALVFLWGKMKTCNTHATFRLR